MTISNLTYCPKCGSKMQGKNHQESETALANASRMIAQHLVFSLQIRQGKQLVLLLGSTGNEKDNMDAIASWVLIKLQNYESWPISTSEAVGLIEDIERELKSILQDISFGWV